MRLIKVKSMIALSILVLYQMFSVPVASAQSVTQGAEAPFEQKLDMESNSISILGTIIDMFSCQHNQDLPWCLG